MATVAQRLPFNERRPDLLSGTPRAHAIDRWIYVFTAALFVLIILTGFIPDSIGKIHAVLTGQRPSFPLVLHMHAVLMASFMVLLLTQTILVATDRCDLHMRLGIAAFVIAPALVVVGFVLVPTMYHQTADALRVAATPAVREKWRQLLLHKENIMLLQVRVGMLFPLFLAIGLRARKLDAGLHKRMMLLASAIPLGAGLDRMTWLPTTATSVATDLYILAAVAPMFLWDLIRNHRVHRAYLLWFVVYLPASALVWSQWDTPRWHSIARALLAA